MPSKAHLIAQIEKAAPRDQSSRAERRKLYAEFAALGAEAEMYVLTAIGCARAISKDSQEERRKHDWYFSTIPGLSRDIAELANHDLISGGLHLEDVTFFQPHEVDCVHGRRTKRCRALGEKVVLLHQLLSGPAAKRLVTRIRSLGQEIKQLDPTVDPATAKARDFCSPLQIDEMGARPIFTDAPPRRQRPSGRPANVLQDSLLENVGHYLVETTRDKPRRVRYTRERAADVVARLLASVFQREANADTVLRHWRTLRTARG